MNERVSQYERGVISNWVRRIVTSTVMAEERNTLSMDQPHYTRALSPSPPFLARCALSTIFFLNGVVLAS